MRRMMTLLILLLAGASDICSDDHTLQYYYMGVSEPLSGLPEYYVVAYVDDKQLYQFSSDTGQVLSLASWMSKEGSEYWERQLWLAKEFQPVFRRNVQLAMRRFNQTRGFHSAQWMYGCELRDDGSIVGYSQMGYDGRDMVFLDKERGVFIAVVHEAQLTAQEWNSPEIKWGERLKAYLEIECRKHINIFIKYGKEDLERRVRPEVKVWGRPQSDDVIKLQCMVYGFHPRAVHVKWVRNGVDDVPSDEMSPILPHPDGTYQIRVSAEVPAREGDTYSCHVDHSSLEEPLSVKWEPTDDRSLGVILGSCLTIVAVAILSVCGVCLYRKIKHGYMSTNTSDTDSSTEPSNSPRA